MKRICAVLLMLSFALLWNFAVATENAKPTEESTPKKSESEDYTYILLEDGTAEIIRYAGNEEYVVIPDQIDGHQLSGIGDSAFDSKHILKTVYIPGCVTRIGANPFSYCEQLQWISVSSDNPVIENIDGVLFDTIEKRLICYPMVWTDSAYTVPDWVEIIGEKAFYINSYLETVNIPESVLEIGSQAFFGCKSLTELTIPNSMRKCGANPFAYCWNLAELNVSENQPFFEMKDGALFSRESNTLISYLSTRQDSEYTIPEGTVVIGDYAFYNCGHLRNITFADSVSTIGNSAFYSCEHIESFDIRNGVETIGKSAFSGCKKAKSIILPDTLHSIGRAAFLMCKSLTEVVIPAQITVIESSTFEACDSLTQVQFMGAITRINERAFYSCKALVSADLPEGITEIGEEAFYQCALETVAIPASTLTIGARAFLSCTNLNSVTIPESVTNIGKNAFAIYNENHMIIPNPLTVMRVRYGSSAELYCLANGLAYKLEE